jgi:hypothetical protein
MFFGARRPSPAITIRAARKISVVIIRMNRHARRDRRARSQSWPRNRSRGITVIIKGVQPEHLTLLANMGIVEALRHENHLIDSWTRRSPTRGPTSTRRCTHEKFPSRNLHGLRANPAGYGSAMFSLGWAGLYVGGGLLVTAAVLVFANRLYGEDQAYRPVRPMAAVVGALWPVLVIGSALRCWCCTSCAATHEAATPPSSHSTPAAARARTRRPTWRISAWRHRRVAGVGSRRCDSPFRSSPQNTTAWADMLAGLEGRRRHRVYESGWTFDHFYPIFSDPTGPCLEGWTTLTALAQATTRLRLGTLVTGVHYRHPAVLANMAAALDIISGGRLRVGYRRRRWNEEESAPTASSSAASRSGSTASRRPAGADRVVGHRLLRFRRPVLPAQTARNEPGPAGRTRRCIGGSGEKRTLRITAPAALELRGRVAREFAHSATCWPHAAPTSAATREIVLGASGSNRT